MLFRYKSANFVIMQEFRKVCKKFLDKYQIQFEKPSLPLLKRVLYTFVTEIPYENISKIIKDGNLSSDRVKLRQPDELIEEHLRFNFGGTCFSLTYTLLCILNTLGFNCYIAMADMKYGKNIHCGIITKLNNLNFLLDPGYMIPYPLVLCTDNSSMITTPANSVVTEYSIEINRYNLYTIENNNKMLRLQFNPDPVSFYNFKKYWHDSFYKNTMDEIMIEKISSDGLFYFRKNHMVHTCKGKKNNRIIDDSRNTFINGFFNIDISFINTAEEILQNKKRVENV